MLFDYTETFQWKKQVETSLTHILKDHDIAGH